MSLLNPHRGAGLVVHTLASLAAACLMHSIGVAATLPAAPKTFDASYSAPTGRTVTVDAGGDLQAALNSAQLGDTIVLKAGATFTGPFRLPNKTTGSGWIYVVSSNLASLPAPGQRVGPNDAQNMPRILAPANMSALTSLANSHHFRFVGIEFAPVSSARIYTLVAIGNSDTSPMTLPDHIVFDRCYVHGDPTVNDRRGIEMDGAYVAVVDSYISDFQEVGADSQGLWAYNTTGPLQITDDYIEAATENVLFGGADSKAPSLVPADIEIRNNYFYKSAAVVGKYPVKNLLEFKAARRALVVGNVFQDTNPWGCAVLITPRNQNGTAPWSITSDITITNNRLTICNGFNILGQDNAQHSLPTARILIRDNLLSLSGSIDGRAFVLLGGGSDYTIDHNTIIYAANPLASGTTLSIAETTTTKFANFTFTNNLGAATRYGFGASGVGGGTTALNAEFTNWVFSKNAIVGAAAAMYPAGNFFPADTAAVRFQNFAAGDYALAASSPYKSAGTDGADIGADLSALPGLAAALPDAPRNVTVR